MCTEEGSSEKGGSTVTARTYTKEEWFKLTKEEREKVKELRKARKRNNQGNRTQGTHNASAIQQEGDEDDDNDSSYSGKSEASSSVDMGNVSSLNRKGTSTPTRRTSKSIES
jgi:hypothetical protein